MLSALAALPLLVAAPADGPFADLELEAALARAKKEEKLLLVDFTAVWCPPCRKMEKETWPDPKVAAWLEAHAVAIQLDVDEYPELSKQYEIESIPTVLAWRGGELFDRSVGFKDAKDFLAWGEDVRAGRTVQQKLIERSTALWNSKNVHARMDLASELLRARLDEHALHHYLWLWSATRADGGGVRTSFMLREIATLMARHEPAKQAFMEILAELQEVLDRPGTPEFRDWQEWTSMCEYFGQRARMVAWYEARRDEQGRLPLESDNDFLVGLIRKDVFDVLVSKDRPVDAIRLYEDAIPFATGIVEDLEERNSSEFRLPDEAMQEQMLRMQRSHFTKDMATIHAALLADDREVEAHKVAALLLGKLDDADSRKTLVRKGLEILGKSRPVFSEWLDQAEAAGANVRSLRRKLERLEPDEPGQTQSEE